MIMSRIEEELELQGLQDLTPSLERVRVFSSAFSEVIDKLPSYRALLLAVQKEYDGLIARQSAELNTAAPTEARLRTMKAASLSYVGESMAWFQIEIAELRKKLKEAEDEIARLKGEIVEHVNQKEELENDTEMAKFMSKESHSQNMDILKHMDRMEKQLELLRKQEKEAQGQMNVLQQRVKEKDGRIFTVEEQLQSERNKVANMVPKEELLAAKEECRVTEQKLEELDESFQAKQRDYMSIVEAYTQLSGQGMDDSMMAEARPLTPRPHWFHCRGLLDPDYQHTVDKAENSQEMLQHMLLLSRTLLSAYGLSVAANKSQVFEQHAKHPLTLPMAVTPADDSTMGGDEDGEVASPESRREKWRSVQKFMAEVEEFLPSDLEQDTPQVFKHSEQVKDLKFSRRRVSDFMENLVQQRHKHGLSNLTGNFAQFIMENIPEEVPEEEKKLWAINMYAALRRYAGEPDFLAYLLLVKGKLSDRVVRDNRRFCSELLKIFINHFEVSDGTHNITKQKFFYGLREVLPNKEKEMWQDLVTYFPAGGAELLVNYEWLLFDDLYVLSPIVYALRLQHLEEAIGLTNRLEELVRGCAEGRKGDTVTYGAVEEAFRDDDQFSLIHAEDLARAFDTHVTDLHSGTKIEVEKFLSVLKQGDIFHLLYFPSLASDEGDPTAQEDIT